MFSHFVRRDTSHLSKAVSSFFGPLLDVMTIDFFSLSIFYLTKVDREQEATYGTSSSCKQHGDNAPPPPSSEIMPKHDEDMGGIGEKNIGGQLGLVRIYLTQRTIKTHDNLL